MAELYGHIAPLRDLLGILQRLGCIGEQLGHLFRTLDIVLPALIAHAVLIRHLLAGLDTQQNVVGFRVLRVSIVAVIGSNERYPGLLRHTEQ